MLTRGDSQEIIIGIYLILFGAGMFLRILINYTGYQELTPELATLLLEFQIPSYMSRWAPFLFSFLGRGICQSCHGGCKCQD